MADVGIWIKNANIAARVGAGANATAKAVAATDIYVLDVESYINVVTKYNWSDNYAALNVDVKYLLMDVGANLCAMYVIQYDTSNYSSTTEVAFMLNFLRDRVEHVLELLKDKAMSYKDWMVAA